MEVQKRRGNFFACTVFLWSSDYNIYKYKDNFKHYYF